MSEGSRPDPRDQTGEESVVPAHAHIPAPVPTHASVHASVHAATHDRGDADAPSRRQLLRLGAVAGAVVLTVRPGIAQAATSVLNCQIPVPDPARASQAVAPDGTMVPKGSAGAYPGGRTFTGEQVRNGLRGGNLPGTSYEESQAYLNYVRRLQHGRSGFTCYASLMMPR